MKAIDTLTNVVGLYALTSGGELGAFGEGNRFVARPELTQAFGPQIRELLKSYLGNPDGGSYRLGVIYHAREKKSWRSDTLVVEEHVLREVYPLSGPPTRELTAFQKKNRAKSIYRGIELLLQYRNERLADSPVYCPLLYDRGTSLDQYPAHLGFGGVEDEPMPAVEVLNLLAMLPPGRRNTPAVLALMQDMQRYLARKDERRGGTLTLLQDERAESKSTSAGPAAVLDIDARRANKQQTIALDDFIQRLAFAEQARQSERHEPVQQWLAHPQRTVDPQLLRRFTQFRDIEDHPLAALAEKALVYAAPGGVRLLELGMKDPWNMYLLEGTVSLQAADGGVRLVSGGSDKATGPISFLKPRKYSVTTVSPASFLWIHDALLHVVASGSDASAPALKPSQI